METGDNTSLSEPLGDQTRENPLHSEDAGGVAPVPPVPPTVEKQPHLSAEAGGFQNRSILQPNAIEAIENAKTDFVSGVSRRVENHHDAFRQDLSPGETITEVFDVFYDDSSMPLWLIILLGLLTFSGFWWYILIMLCCDALGIRCCCFPHFLSIRQARMAITDGGRALVWVQRAKQVLLPECCCCCLECICRWLCLPEFCAPAVTHDVTGTVHAYLLKDVQQVTQAVINSPSCPCTPWCCHNMGSYVRMHFNGMETASPFDLLQPVESLPSLTSSSGRVKKFLDRISSTIFSQLSFDVDPMDVLIKVLQGLTAIFSLSFLVTLNETQFILGLISAIFGTTIYVAAASEDSSAPSIYIICQSDCNTRDLVHAASGSDTDSTRSVVEEISNLHARILAMLPPREAIFCHESATSKRIPQPEFVTGLEGIQIVRDDATVVLPSDLFSKLPGEEVVSAQGVVGQLSFFDLVASVLTAGIWYCLVARKKRDVREAIVCTTHRIVTCTIHQRAGEIPTHFGELGLSVRSYLPDESASCGYLRRGGGWCDEVTASVGLKFGDTSLFFDAAFVGPDKLHMADQFVAFAGALSQSTDRTGKPLETPLTSVGMNLDADKLSLLPMLPTEVLLARLSGRNRYEPFCFGCCSEDTLGCCFPCLPLCCCCQFRPFRLESDMLLTNYSIFALYHRTRGCQPTPDYSVMWSPIRSLMSSTSAISTGGTESWFRRLFKDSSVSMCCPMANSAFLATIFNSDGVPASVTGWTTECDFCSAPDEQIDSTQSERDYADYEPLNVFRDSSARIAVAVVADAAEQDSPV